MRRPNPIARRNLYHPRVQSSGGSWIGVREQKLATWNKLQRTIFQGPATGVGVGVGVGAFNGGEGCFSDSHGDAPNERNAFRLV